MLSLSRELNEEFAPYGAPTKRQQLCRSGVSRERGGLKSPVRIRGLSRLRRIARRMRRWWRGELKGTLILCYHRVAELPQSPHQLWVSPQRFAEQMEVLAKKFVPVSLAEVAKGLREGKVPDKAVAVTFDDGYADNLWNARPILERFGVPATVFVATGLVDKEEEYYWDELERLLLRQETPSRLTLAINEHLGRWQLATLEERLQAYWHLRDWLQSKTPEERETIMERLREHLGADKKGRPTHRLMTVDELRTISHDGLVDIGAHTVHHPDLTALPLERQWWEIVTSKVQLEEWLGRPVRWFAYPYGRGSIATQRLVQEAGFEVACAVAWDAVSKSTNPFWLPRLFVANWDGETFEQKLREVW